MPPPVASTSGFAFSDERTLLAAPVAIKSGYAYADERSLLAGPAAIRNAYAYADENQITPKNPYRMMTYDSATGQYVAAPWYIWSPAAGAWVQAV